MSKLCSPTQSMFRAKVTSFLALVSELFGHVVMLCTVYQNPCVLLLGHDLTDFVILPNKIPIDTSVFLDVSLLIACVVFLFSNDITYNCNSIIVFVCVEISDKWKKLIALVVKFWEYSRKILSIWISLKILIPVSPKFSLVHHNF